MARCGAGRTLTRASPIRPFSPGTGRSSTSSMGGTSEPDAESLMARALAGGGRRPRRRWCHQLRRRRCRLAVGREVTLVTSDSFAGGYSSLAATRSARRRLAGEGTAMERDYWWSSAVYEADLEEPSVGRPPRRRARGASGSTPARRNQARCRWSTIPRIAGGLLSHLAGAISGPSIARGTSFLKDALETEVFAAGITVVDDPHRVRGLRSRPFDGEGVATERRAIIADGVLQTWLLDSRSARQLGLASTGHADARNRRSPRRPPVPTFGWNQARTAPRRSSAAWRAASTSPS